MKLFKVGYGFNFVIIFNFLSILVLAQDEIAPVGDECIYFTSSGSDLFYALYLNGTEYFSTDRINTSMTGLEIIDDVLYIATGAESKINMYNISDSLRYIDNFVNFEEGFSLQALRYHEETNQMFVSTNEYPYIIVVGMNTPGTRSTYYHEAIDSNENTINGAIWNFGIVETSDNRSLLVLPTQANSVYIKYIGDARPVSRIFRQTTYFGTLRMGGVLSSPDRDELWISQGRFASDSDVTTFSISLNGTYLSTILSNNLSGYLDIKRDSEENFYVTGFDSASINKFDYNRTFLGPIYNLSAGIPWMLRIHTCPTYKLPSASPVTIQEEDSSPLLQIVLAVCLGTALLVVVFCLCILLICVAILLQKRRDNRRKISILHEEIFAKSWRDEDELKSLVGDDEEGDIKSKRGLMVMKRDDLESGIFLPENQSFGANSEIEIEIDPHPDPLNNFGISMNSLCPVDALLTTNFTVTNCSKSKKYMYEFFVPENPDLFEMGLYPGKGELLPGDTHQFTVEFTLKATTHLMRYLKLEISEKSTGRMPFPTHNSSSTAVLPTNFFFGFAVSGELSTKLDPEDIEMRLPEIGRGGFGTVYRGKYRGSEVAIKVLNKQSTVEHIEEFYREIALMTKLRSPHVINFIGAVHIPGKLCIVTEFCKEGSVKDWLETQNLLGKPISFRYVLKLLACMAAAVKFLHQNGVIHRDIKPENFMMSNTSSHAVMSRIADFGTSKVVENAMEIFAHTKGLGTPNYMAPELFSDKNSYSAKIDVYSFGIVLYTIYTRSEPYTKMKHAWDVPQFVLDGGRPDIPKGCPKKFSNLIKWCWNENPDNRPVMEEVVMKLKDIKKNTSEDILHQKLLAPVSPPTSGDSALNTVIWSQTLQLARRTGSIIKRTAIDGIGEQNVSDTQKTRKKKRKKKKISKKKKKAKQ